MLKVFTFFCCAFLGTVTQAQILPIEQLNELTETVEPQIQGIRHVKDVNGVLDKYVGTWKGSHNGKNYEILIQKITEDVSDNVKHFHPEPLLWDKLIAKYKITDQNGTVLANTLNLPDDGDKVLPKYVYYDSNTYAFIYYGVNSTCGDNGYLYFLYKNEATLNVVYFLKGTHYDTCSNSAEPSFPVDAQLILTKQ